MKIGNIEIENCLALGPMAGVTDLPFRLLCKEMDATCFTRKWLVQRQFYIKTRIPKNY